MSSVAKGLTCNNYYLDYLLMTAINESESGGHHRHRLIIVIIIIISRHLSKKNLFKIYVHFCPITSKL